jgi:CDP-diglyceride synthetase
MPTGLSERWLQRFAALVALIMIAMSIDPTLDHWWLSLCFLGIVLVLEFLAFRHGVATGIQMYLKMSPKQKLEVEKIIKEEQ